MSEWSEKYEQTAAEVKGQLQETFGAHIVPFRGEDIHFIGSCAVRGMYGKALLDFAIVTRDLLPDIPDAIVVIIILLARAGKFLHCLLWKCVL